MTDVPTTHADDGTVTDDGPAHGRDAAPAEPPRWAQPALLVLLAATAAFYLQNIAVSGWANTYYTAAAQSGGRSWKAMLFGSHDWENAITVDKPPLFLWPMDLSVRIFGFSSWSVLVPQALAGVAAVALLAATVRRCCSDADGYAGARAHLAGLAAGGMLALTPVATMMFRYDNPDAMLTLLLVAAGYATVRAATAAGLRWPAVAGALVGLAFITKMGQALLIVPAMALTFLVAAPVPFRRRLVAVLVAGAGALAGAGWWIAIAELWPKASRPYLGGSTDNSTLELALGPNGLGRLLGAHAPSGMNAVPMPAGGSFPLPGGSLPEGLELPPGLELPAGGMPGGGMFGSSAFGGSPGIDRLFREGIATEGSWLLPLALLALVAGLWLTRRRPRTDPARAGLLLYGGWLVGTGAVFSYMAGIFHPYYTVALAPAVVALPALAGALLWPLRDRRPVRALAAAAVVTTAAWSFHLLSWTPSFVPWLRPVLLVAAAVAVVLLLARGMSGGRSLPRRLPAVAVGATAAVALLGGSTAYSIVTAGQAHSGGVPRSGPDQDVTGTGGIPSTAGMPDIPGMQGFPDVPGTQGLPGIAGLEGLPGAGGTSRADPELVALARSTDTRWAAAAIGSQTAAQLQIESERPVIAVGGFTGSDPAPTLEQFQTMVRNHEVGYFVAGGSGFPGAPRGMAGGPAPAASGQSAGSQIQEWVGKTFPSRNVGGTTVYDLREPK